MGRYDFRPLRVHRTASQLFASERIKNVPPWHEVIGTVPPAQTLVRSQPLQHQEKPRRTKTRKPSKLFQPQRIVYEEDTLRKEFYGDHPWELARPRVVLENDGRDAERKDWSLVSQPDRPVDGERWGTSAAMARIVLTEEVWFNARCSCFMATQRQV